MPENEPKKADGVGDSKDGVDANKKIDDPNKQTDDKKTVDYETYKRVLDQKKNRDRELAEIKEKQAANEKAKMLEKEQYKKLYEETSDKLKDVEGKFGELTKTRIDDFKEAAFLQMLPSDLIKNEYMAHADMSDIIFDETTGSLNKDSVKSVVDKFVKNHSYLLIKKDNNQLPNDAPGNNKKGSLTYDQWLKLPYKEKKKRINDVK